MADIPRQRPIASEAVQEAKPSVFMDTGPLLCFGHMAGGVRVLLGRYRGRLRWAQAVAKEIAIQANWVVRGRTDGFIRSAAEVWHVRQRKHLGEPQAVGDPIAVEDMRAKVRAASRRPHKENGDLGESETLVLAQAESSAALINEDPARRVAARIGVDAYCTLDVLAAEFQEGRIEWRKVLQMYEQLREANLDAGGRLPTPHKARMLKSWSPAGPI